MSKKLFIGLAPLLAIAAFVVVPAAQATTPHYFSNNVKLPASKGNAAEGEEGASYGIGWGTLQLKGETGLAKGSGLSCHNVVAGRIWNPVGGGPGLGETEVFATWDCQNEGACESGETSAATAETLPWPGELNEKGTTAVPFRAKAGLNGIEPTKPVRVLIECEKKGSEKFVAKAPFEGVNEPLAPAGSHKGTSAAHPGFAEFDSGSGELNLVNGFGGEKLGTSKTIGEVKTLGYEEQELVQVK